MKDFALLKKWSSQMGGVFSNRDLSNLFDENVPVALNRRITRLEQNDALTRFIRGYYTIDDFDIKTLSARINSNSYLSVSTVLAETTLIGSIPARTVYAIKTGRNRIYRNNNITLHYLGIAPHLFFGYQSKNGVKSATPEKALLDTLYFYQKGMRFSFNIFTDIDIARVDKTLVMEYLKQYKNPRFISFVKGYMNSGSQ